jgi:hypothetical protein
MATWLFLLLWMCGFLFRICSLLRGHHVVAFVPSIAVRLFQGLLHPLLSQAKFRSLELEIACRL